MRSTQVQQPGTGALAAVLALTILPAVVLVMSESLGLGSYVRLAALGITALAVGVLFFVRPHWGVYFMVFYVYSALNFYAGGTLFAMAVMALILAGVTVGLAAGDSWRLTEPVFLISVAFFALLAWQSMLWAHDIRAAAVNYTKFLKVMAMVVFIVQTVRTPSQLQWLARWIFIGAVATVVLGVANRMLGIQGHLVASAGMVENLRFQGLHANANFAAASMTSAIPMGVYFVRSVKSNLFRVAAILGVLTILVAVFATYSRQAVFAMTFVALAVWFKEVRNRKAYAAMFLVLTLGIILTPRYYWVRLWTVTEVLESAQQDWSIFLRVVAAERAWEMFKDNFFTGVGLRNFAVRSGDALFLRIPAHNIYLEIACGVGVFGLLAYVTAYYAAIRQFAAGMKQRWREQEDWMRHLSYYLMVSLISCLISGVFVNIEFSHFPWILVATGLVIANLRRQ
jgi:O-antigen ligase